MSAGRALAVRRAIEIVPRRCRETTVCVTPECKRTPLAGRHFCAPCQRRLDRIRAEFEREDREGAGARRRPMERAADFGRDPAETVNEPGADPDE